MEDRTPGFPFRPLEIREFGGRIRSLEPGQEILLLPGQQMEREKTAHLYEFMGEPVGMDGGHDQRGVV